MVLLGAQCVQGRVLLQPGSANPAERQPCPLHRQPLQTASLQGIRAGVLQNMAEAPTRRLRQLVKSTLDYAISHAVRDRHDAIAGPYSSLPDPINHTRAGT
jgi:hypothetical protein